MTTGGPSAGEQLLQVAKGNTRFSGSFGGAKVRIGEVHIDDASNSLEQHIAMARYANPVGNAQERADQIVDDHIEVRLPLPSKGPVFQASAFHDLDEQTGRQTVARPTHATFRLETEMRNAAAARKMQRQKVVRAVRRLISHRTRAVEQDDVAWIGTQDALVLRDVRRPFSLQANREVLSALPAS